MNHDAIVVGSGPAGVSAAAALVRRGRKVLMLDAGLRLEPERQDLVGRMTQRDPVSWNGVELSVIKEGMTPGPEGIPLKRLFGSDFAFRESSRFAEVVCDGSDLKMSLALGGLSNVWGAGAIPFCSEDISSWPIKIEALAPFYRECLEEMELAAETDDLASDYPLYTDRALPLQPSQQATAFLGDLKRSRELLRREGITFGASRLAVKAPRGSERGCIYCGLCLYGCPYGLIYNSADAVRKLKEHPNFAYHPDVMVDRVEETGSEVRLHGRGRLGGERLSFCSPQAFLGCGPIPSTAILLESIEAWDVPVKMRDSQYFLVPVLRFRETPGVERERLHTLAQLFLEVRDPAISSKGIHLSVYTYNDLLLEALKKQAGAAGRLFPRLPGAFARHLLVFGGYLHSDESPSIEFSISHFRGGGRQVLLRGLEKPSSGKTVRALLLKLARNTFRFKAVPLLPFVQKGLPGRGFHAGGTFPMSAEPSKFQSDLLGRPHGFSRLHVVDATVFPSIPAPNLTLSIMANARRIAAGACDIGENGAIAQRVESTPDFIAQHGGS